jgi:hypothetical protein
MQTVVVESNGTKAEASKQYSSLCVKPQTNETSNGNKADVLKRHKSICMNTACPAALLVPIEELPADVDPAKKEVC